MEVDFTARRRQLISQHSTPDIASVTIPVRDWRAVFDADDMSKKSIKKIVSFRYNDIHFQ